jgi:hypothetical protein
MFARGLPASGRSSKVFLRAGDPGYCGLPASERPFKVFLRAGDPGL